MSRLLFITVIICACVQARCGISMEDELENEIKDKKVTLTEDVSLERQPILRAVARDGKDRLDIVCYPGQKKRTMWSLWATRTLQLRLGLGTEKYQIYVGPNKTDVYRQHKEMTTSWLFQLMPWRTDSVVLALFNRTCVGISVKEAYAIKLIQKTVDPWLLGYLLSGIILFFSAKHLSKNIMFYYGTGISIGLLASLLILVFIMSRFIPQRYGAFALLLGGWSVTLWLLQYVWENIQHILEKYTMYVIGYFLTAGLVSFAYLYYKGPLSNPRAMNLIKWTLQIVALALIYNGTQIMEASVALMVIALLSQIIPSPFRRGHSYQHKSSASSRGFTFWWRYLPRLVPRPKLLTQDEYEKQGNEETKKALNDLRQYCRSPDCDAWKTVSRLNSPQKFASFVDGAGHLSDDELNSYEFDMAPPNYEDSDESELSFRLSSL